MKQHFGLQLPPTDFASSPTKLTILFSITYTFPSTSLSNLGEVTSVHIDTQNFALL